MKTLVKLSVLPALGFVLLSGDVRAVTASAAFCRPTGGDGSGFAYSAMGFANLGATEGTSTCLIPMDNATLGSTVTFELRGYDNSSSFGFSCNAAIHNEAGANVLGTPLPTEQTTSAAFVGAFTRTWTAKVSGTNVNTNMYAIYCNHMPGNFSVIYAAKVQ